MVNVKIAVFLLIIFCALSVETTLCQTGNPCQKKMFLTISVRLLGEIEDERIRNALAKRVSSELGAQHCFEESEATIELIDDSLERESALIHCAKQLTRSGRNQLAFNLLQKNLPDIKLVQALTKSGLFQEASNLCTEIGESCVLEPACIAALGNVDLAFNQVFGTEIPNPVSEDLAAIGEVCVNQGKFDELVRGYKNLLGDNSDYALAWLVFTKLDRLSDREYRRLVKKTELENRFHFFQLSDRPAIFNSVLFDQRSYSINLDNIFKPSLEGYSLRFTIDSLLMEARNGKSSQYSLLLREASKNFPEERPLFDKDMFSARSYHAYEWTRVLCAAALADDLDFVADEFRKYKRDDLQSIESAILVGMHFKSIEPKTLLVTCKEKGVPIEIISALSLGSGSKPTQHFFPYRSFDLMRFGQIFRERFARKGTASIKYENIPVFVLGADFQTQQSYFRQLCIEGIGKKEVLRFLQCASSRSCDYGSLVTCLDAGSPKVQLLSARMLISNKQFSAELLLREKLGLLASSKEAEIQFAAIQSLSFLEKNFEGSR